MAAEPEYAIIGWGWDGAGTSPGDPRLIGAYRLVGRLGSGGMGKVFLGRSAAGRLVAVKVIRDDLAEDPEFRARFRREVTAASRVSGLFTAPVVDADLDAPVPFLVTAYIAGLSLADAVSRHGPWPAAPVLALAAGLAEGLGAIHAAGVVHRDLKPSNVLLAEDGPRVIDFGISLAAEASKVTRTGMTFGSPGFMSPEQAEGGEVGPASDVFSLGAVLAFTAAGAGPFGAGSTAALVYRVVHSPPDLARMPVRIRPLIERCLAKDAGQRPSPGELLAELDGAGVGPGWLPAPVMQDLPQAAAWPARAASAEDAEGPPARPVTEVAAVPGGPGHGADCAATRTSVAKDPLISESVAGHGPSAPPGAVSASGTPAPGKIRERRRRARGMIGAAVLLAIIGFGAYRLASHNSPAKPLAAPAHLVTASAKPHARPSPAHSPALTIHLTAVEPCWVNLTDSTTGVQIYMGTIPAGSSMTWTENEAVQMVLGNPLGIKLTVNGKLQPTNVNNPEMLTFSPQSG